MANPHKLALIIKSSSNEDEFLLVKQPPPPKFNDNKYDSYLDSPLWDLPSTQLNPSQPLSPSKTLIHGAENLDLSKFDLDSALHQIGRGIDGDWEVCKYVEEAEFGPGPPVHTLFLVGKLRMRAEDHNLLQDELRWMSIQSCLNLLLEVSPSNDRVGPLVVAGLLTNPAKSGSCKISSTLRYQEYPPGIRIMPMRSRTAKPFRTTNIIIVAPDNDTDDSGDSTSVANGDALVIDPGCWSECHAELMEIVAALPRKLVVFVTHHHRDHVDGLSVIQKCNPDAILIAHENTMNRIGKDDWSLRYVKISGAEDICIGGQRLNVILAPGHTDGHMALLHVSSNSLIVGDHCVGQGSAVLDINSGGNMKAYFDTTYNFLELSPHALIPMHGRVNMWPKQMLCGYLKNRSSRESAILKAIESGSETLFDIVAKTYYDVDPSFWVPASSNVRLHVDHLAQQDKLPKEFSLQKFRTSCRVHFLSRWIWLYLRYVFLFKDPKLRKFELLAATAVGGFGMFYAVKSKFTSK